MLIANLFDFHIILSLLNFLLYRRPFLSVVQTKSQHIAKCGDHVSDRSRTQRFRLPLNGVQRIIQEMRIDLGLKLL
ncbi:hypothetical protein D3C84_1216820 [compost metagenome]